MFRFLSVKFNVSDMLMIKYIFPYLVFVTLFSISGCGEKEKEIRYTGSQAFRDCKKQPAFVQNLGFDLSRSAFSTSEKRIKGLSFIQFPSQASPEDRKLYQHPSWTQNGWLGPMAIDANGNIYIAPVPVINVLDNPAEKQNNIYKVNTQTGEMSLFFQLPMETKPHELNPYGILGLVYDCEKDIILASTVAGSDREKVRGRIYSIQTKGTPSVIATLTETDAIGIGVNYLNGEKRVYYGEARTSDIYSVGMNPEGKFQEKPRIECSLADLGPRGDDKARKIRFNQEGDMVVMGVEFNFNLIAPTEKQETPYTFHYDIFTRKWGYIPEKRVQ